MSMSFEELGVRPRLCEALRRQGITTPNPVQRMAIPPIAESLDTVIHAPTGSGKTLAYLLPMIASLNQSSPAGTRALIVGPTRELATQIDSVLRNLGSGLHTAMIFGGVAYGNQLRALRGNPDVVIGCPGRLLDLARQGALRLGKVEYLVLDEADEMLDQGFAKDVEQIIALTTKERQTVLASATLPDWVRTMIAKHLREPQFIHVEKDVEPDLAHGLLAVNQQAKIDTLHQLLTRERGQTIVFHRTKHGAKKLARDLNRLGHSAGELQGNLSQNARDQAMASFRSGRSSVLVATNVAARGIDVAEVGLVINFELPETAEWLTHRVGRTARNGASGRALTFVTPDDGPKWAKLRRQGAPDLAHVDTARLLDDGEWALQPKSERCPSRPPTHRVVRDPSHARPDDARPRPSRPSNPSTPSNRWNGTRRPSPPTRRGTSENGGRSGEPGRSGAGYEFRHNGRQDRNAHRDHSARRETTDQGRAASSEHRPTNSAR